LTQNLGVLWARHNIRINAIAPGYIETPLTKGRRFRQPGALESILRRIPLQRLGKPEDTVGAVLYLASDASAYVTGQTIVVSGGLSNLIPADYRD
jgi:3-oxoacyl-[acyl-carrier protein] reductase